MYLTEKLTLQQTVLFLSIVDVGESERDIDVLKLLSGLSTARATSIAIAALERDGLVKKFKGADKQWCVKPTRKSKITCSEKHPDSVSVRIKAYNATVVDPMAAHNMSMGTVNKKHDTVAKPATEKPKAAPATPNKDVSADKDATPCTDEPTDTDVPPTDELFVGTLVAADINDACVVPNTSTLGDTEKAFDVDIALAKLEKKLTALPVSIPAIADVDIKLAMLDKLIEITETSISDQLAEIRTFLSHTQALRDCL